MNPLAESQDHGLQPAPRSYPVQLFCATHRAKLEAQKPPDATLLCLLGLHKNQSLLVIEALELLFIQDQKKTALDLWHDLQHTRTSRNQRTPVSQTGVSKNRKMAVQKSSKNVPKMFQICSKFVPKINYVLFLYVSVQRGRSKYVPNLFQICSRANFWTALLDVRKCSKNVLQKSHTSLRDISQRPEMVANIFSVGPRLGTQKQLPTRHLCLIFVTRHRRE